MCWKIAIFVRPQIETCNESLTYKKDRHAEYVNLEFSIFAYVLSWWKNSLNFNNAKFSISYWCRVHIFLIDGGAHPPLLAKQDFSIHGGICTSHYVNNAVFRWARATMRTCKFKAQSATCVSAIHIQRWCCSFFSISDTVPTPDPSSPSMEAIAKLSLLPSHNDKMMTGLWPCGLQESCWQAQSIKEKKKYWKMERSVHCPIFTARHHFSKQRSLELNSFQIWNLMANHCFPSRMFQIFFFPGWITVFNSTSCRDFNLFY